ncbi:efflux RND transporter periplasmic adaptor subunit [Desulfitobacterium metallireducens]|uniref:Secretion protein HylD n=1 Tax=Desulfitobacterium metallireducens DSM 15288 TaxID=871968 RepID=W0EAU0_9FIRM|nr:HlyD family efflux transporter periplasmic adaptor subunit [Desulfitobacterium metallireducens]AHF07990.1 secretion protein HylD [Desulfitobacterium metallireducens DSM 15288]
MKIKLPKKKWITIGVLGIILIGGGVWAYKSFAVKPATSTTITGQVQRGDVRNVISATGSVSYPKTVNLTFEQTEKLVALNVAVGDNVKAGQVLMQIDPSNLQQTVNQQQANLASAQAKLLQAQENALPTALSALAQAQQNINTKQTALTTAQNNADSAYLTNQVYLAEQNVTQASNSLAQAMASGDSTIQSKQTALNQAQQALTTAQNNQNGGAAATLTAAQSDYEVAQQNLALAQKKVDQLNQGQNSADILTAQTAVQQAEAQLQTAQTNLGKATMVAPYDGVITAVSGQVGQVMDSSSGSNGSSSSTKPGVTLAANPDALQVVTSIGQADINKIKVGQKAEITLDTEPNTKIPGTVSVIAVQGTSTSNVTTFEVRVMIDEPTTILKAGMNANVNIILDEVKDVLTIPSQALKTINGKNFVLIPNSSGSSNSSDAAGGKRNNQSAGANNSSARNASGIAANTQMVPVEIGLNDGTRVEIKSGLTEGQEIVVSIVANSTSSSSSSQKSSSTNPFGGGQGGSSMGNLNRATSTGGGNRAPAGAPASGN